MRLVAVQTVKVKGGHVPPGTEFDIEEKDGKGLVASGAAIAVVQADRPAAQKP